MQGKRWVIMSLLLHDMPSDYEGMMHHGREQIAAAWPCIGHGATGAAILQVGNPPVPLFGIESANVT